MVSQSGKQQKSEFDLTLRASPVRLHITEEALLH